MNKISRYSFSLQMVQYSFTSRFVWRKSEQSRAGSCKVDASGTCFQQTGARFGELGKEVESDLLEYVEQEGVVYIAPMI